MTDDDAPDDPPAPADEKERLLRRVLAERVKVMAVIRSIVRGRELAEDVFQDLCVLAIQKRSEIVDDRHLAGWMRVAARKLALNAARKMANRSVALGDHVHDLMEPHWRRHDAASSSALGEALEACVGKLSETARRLIEARYVEGLDCGSLARRVNRPLASLYVSLSRIHKQLADCVLRRVAAAGHGGARHA